VLRLNYTSNQHRNGTLPHVDTTNAMSEFDEYAHGRTTPYQQESSGAQTTDERNAVARIEFCPRLPAHTDSTVALIDSDVALRYGPCLLHAPLDRLPDGHLATGVEPVVSTAHDPYPADVDEDYNRKWKDDDIVTHLVITNTWNVDMIKCVIRSSRSNNIQGSHEVINKILTVQIQTISIYVVQE